MDRQQAKRLIIETFEKPFDKSKFTEFIANLLKTYDRTKTFIYQGNYIPDAFEKYISSLERIGQYTYDDKEIDLLIVYLKKEASLERARTMQRNFIAWYLKGSRGGKLKDAGLVAFVAPDSEDWRFSLVKMDYKFEETPSGKVKVKEEFTPARRWSYLVGKNEKSHTAQSRFLPILENDDLRPTLEDLEKAFDVEVVTKEFFQKYRDLFIRTKSELDKIVQKDAKVKKEFEDKNINTVDFAKKLLGQIVFLYFLQKKGWFGVDRGKPWGTGPKDFMRRLFTKEYGDYKNFYNDILEPLFYEALRTDRSADDHYYSRFNCKIPFLNGGLFDPINNFDWVNVDLLLPNSLFSNNNRTKEGDIGDGILDIFDRYNFTVNEEEPLEKEVALDPELLGKIYEKLNAIRPDNFDEYVEVLESGKKGEETKFNKEYGVYYTPREIVHYMCKESLINYLETELMGKVSKDEIEKFIELADSVQEREAIALEREEKIKRGEQKSTRYDSQIPESIKQYANEIDALLADIKVCDPAVGSGAFPIGMMHEILKLRQLLSIYLGKNVKTYDLKRDCIENSLYGVDIDPGAVEICKLRFWLSLIVDEEDFYNIKPLPNLEYKVVCGDSLLSYSYRTQGLEKIEKLKNRYFNETNPLKKQALKKEIDDVIYNQFKNSEKSVGYKVTMDFQINFSEIFSTKGGFDIVIENPPYVRQERIKTYKPLLKQANYEVFNATSDLYTYFYEKSYKITKPTGFTCIISSNKWMRAKYGQKLRNLLKNKTIIKQIIDFNGYPVFEATVDTNIILFQNKKPDLSHTFKAITVDRDFDVSSIMEYIRGKSIQIEQSKLETRCFVLAEDKILKLKEKIEKIGKPLKDWDVRIYRGVLTGYNEAFIITTERRNEILANCKDREERKRTEEIIKPILRGRDIGRYYYKWAGLWVIATFPTLRLNIEKYPALKKYFLNNFDIRQLEQSGKKYPNLGFNARKKTGNRWFETQDNIAYYPEFEKEKIVWQRVTQVFSFCYVPTGLHVLDSMAFFTGQNIKYLLGILNSNLVDWYIRTYVHQYADTGFLLSNQYVERIVAPPITPETKPIAEQIESIVSQILSLTQSEDYLQNPKKQAKVQELEKEIDWLVYKLYGLTEEEIKIVERTG